MRKLASIKIVDKIIPIEGADAIECAKIGGWSIVVKKGEVSEGEKVVYFEIDSFLPVEEKYEFLRKSSFRNMDGKDGFRLKTVKLRGQVSQGLILPLSIFPEITEELSDVGEDVTELLKIEKWEPPIPASLAGDVVGVIPTYLFPKTDEERIQNLPEYWDKYKDVEFEESEKLDGSSMTVFVCSFAEDERHRFGVCSRNLQLKESESNTLWRLARKYKIIESLQNLNLNLAIQGELYGEGIQGNPEKIKGQEFAVYKIYDIEKQEFLSEEKREEIVALLKLKTVPILNKKIKIFQECKTMDSLIERASGKSSINNTSNREGLVFKSKNVSFKVISNEYLLKHSER